MVSLLETQKWRTSWQTGTGASSAMTYRGTDRREGSVSSTAPRAQNSSSEFIMVIHYRGFYRTLSPSSFSRLLDCDMMGAKIIPPTNVDGGFKKDFKTIGLASPTFICWANSVSKSNADPSSGVWSTGSYFFSHCISRFMYPVEKGIAFNHFGSNSMRSAVVFQASEWSVPSVPS